MNPNGDILVERHGSVAHITLRNVGRRNAISVGMWDALAAFCGKARHDPSLRSIIILGAGDVFSAGADISGFADARSASRTRDYDDLIESTVSQLEELPQLVIAAISGHCIGAGASLACACDFRICARNAFFSVPAARLGLGYDPRGIARFMRVFGESIAKEVVLLAGKITAQRAYDLGAVHRITDEELVLAEAQDMATRAATLAPLTQRAAKAAIRELGSRSLPSDILFKLAAAADASEDYAEGRAAFAEKRKPDFKGR